TGGIVLEKSPSNLPLSAVGLGERLRNSIENIIVSESSSPRKGQWPPPSLKHRSMDGEPFSFQTPATLKLPEKNGGSPFLSCRRRHARYAWPYRPFPPFCHPPWTFGWTTLRCKEQ
ncbi:mucin-associated surface protein (MASP), partial [Trypanosoma cruzi]